MRGIQRTDVTKASVIRYLNNWAIQEWKDKDVFGEPIRLLYNDYIQFTRDKTTIFRYKDLVDFLKRTVEYIFTIKTFTWCYQTKVRDRNNNTVLLTHRIMSKVAPFTGNDDVCIKTFPPLATLVAYLQKKIPKIVNCVAAVELKVMLTKLIRPYYYFYL